MCLRSSKIRKAIKGSLKSLPCNCGFKSSVGREGSAPGWAGEGGENPSGTFLAPRVLGLGAVGDQGDTNPCPGSPVLPPASPAQLCRVAQCREYSRVHPYGVCIGDKHRVYVCTEKEHAYTCVGGVFSMYLYIY